MPSNSGKIDLPQLQQQAARLGMTPHYLRAAYSQAIMDRLAAASEPSWLDCFHDIHAPVEMPKLREVFKARAAALPAKTKKIAQIVMVGAPGVVAPERDGEFYDFDTARARVVLKRLHEEGWPVKSDVDIVTADAAWGRDFNDPEFFMRSLAEDETRLAASCYIFDRSLTESARLAWGHSALRHDVGVFMTFGTPPEINTRNLAIRDKSGHRPYRVIVPSLTADDRRQPYAHMANALGFLFMPGVAMRRDIVADWQAGGVFNGACRVDRPWSYRASHLRI